MSEAATTEQTATTTTAPAEATTQAAPVEAQAATTTEATTTQAAESSDPTKDDGGKTAEAAPVDIEYKFNLPEGVELDPELSGKFIEFAKSKKLTNEEAQALVDIRLEEVQKQNEAHIAMVNQWAEQAKADKEIGGSSFDQNLAVAKSALSAFASPELKKLLDETGFGNNPEVIRAFYKIGKAVGEDKLVNRNTVTDMSSESIAKRMYPNMND